MMCKKFICLVSLLVFSFACTTYADHVIGDFEGTLDGWTGAWAGTEDLGNSTVGATLNEQSLSVKVGPGDFWKLQIDTQLNLADGATAIEADITFIAAEWPDPNSWLNVHKIAIQDHTDWAWQEVDLPGMTLTKISGADLQGPDADGNVAWWRPELGDATWTVSWSLEGKTLTNDVYSLFLSLQNTNIAKENAGLIYVDNVKVVGAEAPPPTKIVYVDAAEGDEGNTMLASGEVFTSTEDGSGSDNLWRGRVFANSGTIFESGGQYGETVNTEDCPRLVTSVEVPEGDYDVYVYFWTDGSPWSIQASLANVEGGDLPLFVGGGAPEGTPLPTAAVAEDFEEPVPMLTEGNRTLWQAYLGATGQTTAIDVFIDDDPNHLTHNGRTWYDGIGYKVAVPPSPKIIWVTDADIDRDLDGVQDDQAWIDWLVAEGYDVDARPGYWMAIGGEDANDVNDYVGELNAADLVILSRTASSGDYNQEGEPALWNSVTAPLISLSAWHLRNNRWLWIDSGTVVRDNISFMEVLDTTHPVFADVELDSDGLVEPVDPEVYSADVGYRGTCFVQIDGLDMGNGTLLAKSLAELPWIAVWEAGVEFYDGAGQIAGGPRMMFSAGTQDEAGAVPQGAWNLTDAGEQMFRNAVEYMLSLNPVPIELENASFELPGTEKIKGWNGEGVAGTPAEDIPGWASDTEVTDSGVETGWGATDGEWTGFLRGSDPSVWQLTSYEIGADDVIELKVDSKNNWQATTLQLNLYYDDGGARVTAASVDVALTDAMQEFSLVLSAADVPDAAGKLLGIELNNVTPDVDSWLAIDNVRLNLLP